MSQHTPTRWHVTRPSVGATLPYDGYGVSFDDNNESGFTIDSSRSFDGFPPAPDYIERDRACAEAVVSLQNSHAELTAQRAELVAALKEVCHTNDPESRATFEDYIKAFRAARAAAKEA